MAHSPLPIRLLEANWITPNVRHLIFQVCTDAPFPFVPGQFITLHFPASPRNPAFHRSYSLANLCTDRVHNTLIEFAVSRVPGGLATEILFELNPQEQPGELYATGPFGRLILPETWDPMHKRLVLVATGTGVTPYRAMLPQLQQLLHEEAVEHIVLLLGVRDKRELLYADDFRDFAMRHSAFDFVPCYSRETEEDLLPGEKRGYVQSYFSDLRPQAQYDLFYLCGNPNMVDAAYHILTENGFSTKNVRREKYISSAAISKQKNN